MLRHAIRVILIAATSGCLAPPPPAKSSRADAAPEGATPDGASARADRALAEAREGQKKLDAMSDAVFAKMKGEAGASPEGVKEIVRDFEALFAARPAQEARLKALRAADEDQRLINSYSGLVDEFNRIPKEIHDPQLLAKLHAMSAPKSDAAEDIRVADALEAFMFAHRDRFRFLNRDVQGGETQRYHPSTRQRPLVKGEVVLLEGNQRAVAVDGTAATVTLADLSSAPLPKSFPHPLDPSWLSVRHNGKTVGNYATLVLTDSTGYELANADFLELASPSTPGYDAFTESRAKTIACFDEEMKRLDPSGTRKRWLLETHQGGNAKLEHLADVYDRKACQKCGCARFKEQRRKLARTVLAPHQAEVYRAITPRIARVTSLFAADKASP